MGKYKFYEPDPETVPEIDGVITADGLVAKGPKYARKINGKIQITAEGYALLGDQLRARARENEGKWHGVTGVHDTAPPQPGIRELPRDAR
jgi:hypothetical protein